MKFDDVLRDIGEFGPYQRRVYVLATVGALLVAFETLSAIFIFFIPLHRCAIPGYPQDTYQAHNESHEQLINVAIPRSGNHLDQCHVNNDFDTFNVTLQLNESRLYVTNTSQSKCNSWVFDSSVFRSTASTDFKVVCDRSVERANSNMISEIGTLIGAFASGFISDRFGRKTTFCIGGLALLSGGFGITFTNSLSTFNICRFILGLARMAVFVNGLVIGMEIVGPSKRTFAGIAIEVIWCIGELLLLVCAYFIREWRYLELCFAVPSIGLLFYWWLVPESPRWLLSRNRKKEAMEVLERIAASNKTKLPSVKEGESLFEGETTLGYRHLFRSRELLVRLFLVFSNLFVITVVYYGLTLNITNLSGNIFINGTINIFLEAIAYISTYFLLDRLGRKPVLVFSMVMGGLFCVGSVIPVLLNAPESIVVGLSMAGRFCICSSYAVIYLYGAELFPTVIRSIAMGITVSFSRIGSISSPYMADVGILVGGQFEDALPLIIMGSPAIVVGMLSLWLPETSRTILPEKIEDLKSIRWKDCYSCCSKISPATREVILDEDGGDADKKATLL